MNKKHFKVYDCLSYETLVQNVHPDQNYNGIIAKSSIDLYTIKSFQEESVRLRMKDNDNQVTINGVGITLDDSRNIFAIVDFDEFFATIQNHVND